VTDAPSSGPGEPGDPDGPPSGPAAIEAAASVLGDRARRAVPVGPLTTYRVGGPAALFLEAAGLDDLLLATKALAVSGLPVLVMGRGSNLLVADGGFPGLVVTLAPDAFGAIEPGPGHRVRAGGAVYLPVLARQTAAAGLTGMEWAVGVPGSVGGAVRMNAGGHGADTSQTLVSCRWVDLRHGSVVDVNAADLHFGYRRSAVGAHQVVIAADFDLAPGDRATSEATIRDIVRWRREHQPGGQNAGSVFSNPAGVPPKNSAGWLVDAAGLKGRRRGSAIVSEKHANFIQADPGGSADDVRDLILEVQQLVAERLGVELHPEVKLVGFRGPSTSAGCTEADQ
jgi:UDP-N-acetylmuramate dehydrogenase